MDGKIKIIKTGYVAVIDGEEVWVNTTIDERIVIAIKDKELR